MPAKTSTAITLDQRALQRLLIRVRSGAALKAATITQERVRANIRRQDRIRSGAMLASVRVAPARIAEYHLSTYQVRSDLDYTVFQEGGIGPVHARPGHVLRFQPKGSAVFIFRPRTKGFKGGHFFRDAERAIRFTDFL